MKDTLERPWVEKYRPQSIKEMAIPQAKVSGHRVALDEELRTFIKTFLTEIQNINEKNKKIRIYNRTVEDKKQKKELSVPPEKSAVLLEGPPGVGKTSIVYALANDLNMEVIETNASDTRTRDALESKLKETVKSRGIMDFIVQSKAKLILIDEIDGIYGVTDRGAVPAVLDLIENTQFPIIMCSNDYKRNLQTLYNKIRKIEISALSKDEILKVVKRILKKEKIDNFNPKDLNYIIEKNEGDLRGTINDLQGIYQGGLDTDTSELIYQLNRDNNEEIFSLIRELFQDARTLQQARNITDKSDVDYNFLYKWINENLPTFIKKTNELKTAYENLSLADEVFGRIRKNQYWSLLPYFYDLFSGGVVLARKYHPENEGFRRINFPRFTSTGFFSLTVAEHSFVEKIQEKYNVSEIEIIQNLLPFLRKLTSDSRKYLKLVSDWFDLDAKEKKLLTK
ncbi:MAG: replication factor C large subunit [Promethearchaeota archaeon]|nr:MAG: replication factor C large subunit [Candidatus Lokiarchaeota archaeon]